jgi:isochorismate synthase
VFAVLQPPLSITAPDLIHTNIKHVSSLPQLFNAAQQAELPLISYRLPGESEPETLIQIDKTVDYWSDGAADGFIVAPFDFPESPARWLRADLAFSGFEFSLNQARTGKLSVAQMLQLSEFYEYVSTQHETFQANGLSAAGAAVDRETYETQVAAILTCLNRGALDKLVLSRIKQVPLDGTTHPAKLFQKLCMAYPSAFVSLVSIPDWGLWLGASPELLLQSDGEQFQTMSLAGTRRLCDQPREWTEKEKTEQHLVTEYICETLKNAGLNVQVMPRETVNAGQVQHLRNLIQAQGPASVFKLVNELHPTPAVCGLPVQHARNYIRFHEAHQRRLYGGFLGRVSATGKHQLFVNLRNMELHKGIASLYLGAGIVKGSNPAAEWLETEHKAGTLLRILQP